LALWSLPKGNRTITTRKANTSYILPGSFLDDDDDRGWRRVIDVDLTAALHGVRLSARHMSAAGGGGTIMVVASAGGVFPIPGNTYLHHSRHSTVNKPILNVVP